MDLIDRYLNAVAAQLPQDERADITAELRDLILSRFEAKEEALGRALTEDEQEAILREIGHPLVVAARYRKGPDSLVGPELFPYWLFGVKAGLMVLAAVFALTLFIRVVSGSDNFGQDIAHAFHGFFGAGLTLIGAATLAAAIFEHQGIRPAWLTKWRVKDLGTFGLADPAAWGASMTGTETAKTSWLPKPRSKPWPGGEYLFSFLATGMFVLWWIGVLHFPGLLSVELRGEDAAVSGAPVWSILWGPILLYAFAQMAIDLASVVRPYAVRARAAARIVIAGAGLWLTWAIFEAGHWFTLTRDGETARIAGDWTMLDFDTLRNLGDGARDLAGVAGTLSVVMVWALAFSALSMAFSVLANLGRLARGR